MKFTIPVVALVLAVSVVTTAIAFDSTGSKQIPSPTSVIDNLKALDKSTEKFTVESLAGEYIIAIAYPKKREMESAGIKEIKANIVLKTNSTFEGQVIIFGVPPETPKSFICRSQGEFKVEGNTIILTTKYQTVDGKETKASAVAHKYTILADGKALKPDDRGQEGISFVRK